MTRTFVGAVLLAMSITFTSPLLAQQKRDTAPPPQGTGRISGTVVGAESGRPVRFARVTLGASSSLPVVITGDDGSFVFDRLKPGTYTLDVQKLGYLETSYGQVRPGTATPGKRITLADREQIERLTIPLSQGGAISGVVRDDRGDPLYRAHVRVARWVMRNGVRTLEAVESTETDEHGRYRMSLLPPRSYVVSAWPAEHAIPETKQGPRPSQGFAPVFYPGAMSARSASSLSLGLGEHRSDVDIQLPLIALGRVTGAVVGPDGRPIPNVPVALIDGERDDAEHGAQTDGAGRFVFERVVPGTYAVRAGLVMGHGHFKLSSKMITLDGVEEFSIAIDRKGDISALSRSLEKARDWIAADADPAANNVPKGSALGEVTVTSNNTADITLTFDPPRSVAGRIVTDGAARAPILRGTVVALIPQSASFEPQEAKVTEDGTFVVAGVAPGKYLVNFSGEAPPWNLASAVSNGVEALDFLLEVPRDRDVRDLVLTLRDRSSELSGTVTDSLAKPAGDRTVIVFASDERLWAAGERRIRAANLADDGKFVFDDLRPGSYLLAMTDSVEEDEWLDPEFLRKLIPAAVTITVGEGEKRVQDLRIR